MTVSDFKEELKRVIIESQLTIREIAEKSGVAASTIYDWINYDRTPSVDSAQWVIDALGYKINLEDKNISHEEESSI